MENKMIKIQIKTWLGKVIFEYESENNSIKETLLESIKRGANLRGANLSDAENKETAYLPIFCKYSANGCIVL